MAIAVNNLIIDRILGAYGMNKKGEILFAINQVTDASLNVTSESTDAVDAVGNTIMTIYRAKKAEFSAANAIFDLDLLSVQSGSKKQVASSDKVILVPAFDEIVIDGSASYTLAHTPVDDDVKVYRLNGDGSVGDPYELSTAASATAFAYSEGKITPPTGLTNDDRLMAVYEYNANGTDGNNAVAVISSAKDFPETVKFVVQALCYDPCDQQTKIYALIIFENFRISPDFDWNISTEGNLPFSGVANIDYCRKNQELFRVVIPG
jgi:hypothetical protein